MLRMGRTMKPSSYLSMRYSHHISAWNYSHVSLHDAVVGYQHFFLFLTFHALLTLKFPLPQVSHHGHSHAHSHLHSAPRNISSVAWMVICGDGIHNLADGFVYSINCYVGILILFPSDLQSARLLLLVIFPVCQPVLPSSVMSCPMRLETLPC